MRINNKTIKITIGVFIFLFQLSYGQKKSIYFKFESESKEVYLIENGSGENVKELIYLKNKKENGNIIFYIKGQRFVYEKAKMIKKICNSSELSIEELLSPNEVVRYVAKVQKKYPMWYKYPSKEYPKIFIVESLINCRVVLFEVNWQYYIQ